MRIVVVFLALCAMPGCSSEPRLVVGNTKEKVTIVHINQDTNWIPGFTVVEFPDGKRISRTGVWGQVGDKFTAVREWRAGHEVGWR